MCQQYASLDIYKIYVYIIYVTMIIVSSPDLNSLVASPVKASGEEDDVDEFAGAPVPKADMMRAPKLSVAGVEVGVDAPAAQV